MPEILVTGASGMLGRHLCRVLHEHDISFRAASRNKPRLDFEIDYIKMDLDTGKGLEDALKGIKYIFHLASRGMDKKQITDAESTKRILKTCGSRISHFIYISIVGIDKIPFGYYIDKLNAEENILASGIPFTILRATQFHDFIDMLLKIQGRFPVYFLPKKFKFQTIETPAAAKELLKIYNNGPKDDIINIGGPRVMNWGEMAKSWAKAGNLNKLFINLPLPGKAANGFRHGYNTCDEKSEYSNTWEEYLKNKYKN
jgi:uncharacterized protein YbjT (DUF2867 family)